MDNMREVFPGLSVGVPLAEELLAGLSGEDRDGAFVIHHQGGDAVIYKARSVGNQDWSYQARYGSSGCASSAWFSFTAAWAAKREIERMKREQNG